MPNNRETFLFNKLVLRNLVENSHFFPMLLSCGAEVKHLLYVSFKYGIAHSLIC